MAKKNKNLLIILFVGIILLLLTIFMINKNSLNNTKIISSLGIEIKTAEIYPSTPLYSGNCGSSTNFSWTLRVNTVLSNYNNSWEPFCTWYVKSSKDKDWSIGSSGNYELNNIYVNADISNSNMVKVCCGNDQDTIITTDHHVVLNNSEESVRCSEPVLVNSCKSS